MLDELAASAVTTVGIRKQFILLSLFTWCSANPNFGLSPKSSH